MKIFETLNNMNLEKMNETFYEVQILHNGRLTKYLIIILNMVIKA